MSETISVVLSVFPDKERTQQIEKLVEKSGNLCRHQAITGDSAIALLERGEELKDSISRLSTELRLGRDVPECDRFSESTRGAFHIYADTVRYLVVSPTLVPLDMARDEKGTYLGDSCIFSHALVGNATITPLLLNQLLTPMKLPLESYLLLCPMAMDRPLPRHLQDIVVVALSLEQDMPVELWLQPSLERARDSFQMSHLSWLHIDTHGDTDGNLIMLGPTRNLADMVGADGLPATVTVPLILAVGCSLTSQSTSIGSELVT